MSTIYNCLIIIWLGVIPQPMSRIVTKPTKWHVCPAKTQISLGIRPVWSESLQCAQWVAKDPSFLQTADSEDSDMIFCWAHSHFVGFVMRRLSVLFHFFFLLTDLIFDLCKLYAGCFLFV